MHTTTCASVTIGLFIFNYSNIRNCKSGINLPGLFSIPGVNGELRTGANWFWYSGGCGLNYEGTGSSIIVQPTSITYYYLRGEGML